jgi:hypothetical protein
MNCSEGDVHSSANNREKRKGKRRKKATCGDREGKANRYQRRGPSIQTIVSKILHWRLVQRT